MALMEEFYPGRGENLHDYLIPTIGDMPPVESILIEDPSPARPVRRQGHRRAGADPDRARHPQRHPPRDRRAHPPRAGDARPGARRDPGGAPCSKLKRSAPMPRDDKIRCDACPVLCYIRRGAAGACDRYANRDGELVRVDPACRCSTAPSQGGGGVVPFLGASRTGTARIVEPADTFVTAIGAGTTYPDYKPAPFIVSSEVDGRRHGHRRDRGHLQLLRRQGEDRHRPPSRARNAPPCAPRAKQVGHVTTGEYGSQMLSLGGVHHLTGGSQEGGPRHLRDAARPLQRQGRSSSTVDGGATVVVAGRASRRSSTARRRSACGSAAARPRSACSPSNGTATSTRWWWSTTTSPASSPSIRPASCSACRDTGIKMKGRRSTPGRYFQVAEPGTGWGGTDIADPLSILGAVRRQGGAGPACAC